MVAATSQIADECRKERSNFKKTGEQRSPSCVELFRRAFNEDQEAWSAIHNTFKPLVESWIGVQSQVEPEEIVQDAFLNFFRSASKKPTLVEPEYLGPLLKYLKKTTKTSILMALRKEKKHQLQVPIDSVPPIVTDTDDNKQTDLHIALVERIGVLLEDDKERLVFDARFVNNIGPRDIYTNNRDIFDDYKEVATIIQRLTRRLRRDPVLLDLKGERQNEPEIALLTIELLDEADNGATKDRQNSAMNDNCQYDEVALLDYITGLADRELRAGIEKSPACVRAAAELRSDLAPLFSAVSALNCPAPDQLVAYQEREMDATKRLLLYRHIDKCGDCKDELEILRAVDAVDAAEKTNPLRRLVEAVLQPMQALPQPLRGTPQTYKAGDLQVNLTVSREINQRYQWRMRGQVRGAEGQKFVDIEQIILTEASVVDSNQQSITLNEHGSFAFANLATGVYELAIIGSEAELIIPSIKIGEQVFAEPDI